MTSIDSLPVLLVDDEPQVLMIEELTLKSVGLCRFLTCEDSRQVLPLLERNDVGLVLLDLSMPHLSGQHLLTAIGEGWPEVPVIVVTGANDVATAVSCIKAGAVDYLVKPVEGSRLQSAVRSALELRRLRLETESLRRRLLSRDLEHPEAFADIVTNDPSLRDIFAYLEAIAPTQRPVLISGETGVGKELFARALHRLSGRTGPLLAANVAGIDDNTFSDTLFGHRKGAFTGAEQARPGMLKEAAGGTLILDEIGDLTAASQVKLLRLLQEGEYQPLGADLPQRSTARIVAITNRDIDRLVTNGSFRADLYFRLRTHHVRVPPLRERRGDLPLLVSRFLDLSADIVGRERPKAPDSLLDLLATYDFPGNVRELESMIFDAVSASPGKSLSINTFRAAIGSLAATTGEQRPAVSLVELDRLPTLREASRLLIDEALRRTGGNQTLAAQLLGITQSSLSKRLKRMDERGGDDD